eukprot:TRINITY_DN35590_c0_g1_i1.p1 TRINITY_DN35590_c0_g1~~TRINITY_DN35590_c0_g1_i1.p1  ORF type:complete len:150 (-),score=40.60 TRINITY_DN35590_c0_g1_i1:44-469(-)
MTVGEVTRLVKVMPGKLTMVKFEVARKGMPWLVVFSIMATGLGLSFLVMSICRRRSKAGFKGSKVGFQKLTDKSEVFTDSDEEDIEFDKTLAKLGLPPSQLHTVTIRMLQTVIVMRMTCFSLTLSVEDGDTTISDIVSVGL